MSATHRPRRISRSFATAALSAAALTAATLAPAADCNAAPAGPQQVDQIVGQLQASGYDVIVNKVGTIPTSNCAISAVRPGQTYSRTDSGSGTPGAHDDLTTTVTGQTVYVDLAC